MDRSRARIALPLVSSVVLAIAAGTLIAGPLTPPAGPVGTTFKTLMDVEPRIAINAANTPGDANSVFRITQPGSYYLTENLAVGAGKHGIEIEASHVTIDLNGFAVYGFPGSYDGITAGGGFRVGVQIRNGVIRTFGGHGVDLLTIGQTTVPQSAVFENLHVADNTSSGIRANDGQARHCSFNRNGGTGLSFGKSIVSLIESCTATDNLYSGLAMYDGVIRDSSAQSNGSDGISNSEGSVINCTATDNNLGIFGGTVLDCTALDNVTDGIRVNIAALNNHVVRNSTVGRGTNGIAVNNDRVRVEGNSISGFPVGVKSLNSYSNGLIVRNSFTWCTTAISVGAGNRVGAILLGTSSPAINGNAGGGIGTTDPYANLLY